MTTAKTNPIGSTYLRPLPRPERHLVVAVPLRILEESPTPLPVVHRRRPRRNTKAERVVQLAQAFGRIDADALTETLTISRGAAHALLSRLAAEKRLVRQEIGVYVAKASG